MGLTTRNNHITCFGEKCKLKIGENRYFSRFRSIPRYNSTGNAGWRGPHRSFVFDADNTIDKESASTTRQYSFKEKFISTFLNIKLKKKKKKKEDNKLIEDEFINKNLKLKDVYTFENESNYSEEIEEPNALKFRNMVKKVLRIKKNKNWEEFLKEYERKMKQEKSVKFRMKNIFKSYKLIFILNTNCRTA